MRASAMVFIAASPFSKSAPTILSIFMNMQKALHMKLFSPFMVQVTTVCSPFGSNENSAALVAANGLKNSSLMRTNSPGWLSVSVMRPSPTSLLPTHEYIAPGPAAGPSYDRFSAGSFFSHGDQARHLRKSFTCSNTASGGAPIVAERTMRNFDGRIATTTRNSTTTTASPMRMILNMVTFSFWLPDFFCLRARLSLCRAGLAAAALFLRLQFLQVAVQPVEALVPEAAVVLHPVGGVLQRLGAEPARPPLRLPAAFDQPGAFQHFQMLGDAGEA